VEAIRLGRVTEVERFWRLHLEHMRDLVLAASPDRSPSTPAA
jgi:hypothetical protein